MSAPEPRLVETREWRNARAADVLTVDRLMDELGEELGIDFRADPQTHYVMTEDTATGGIVMRVYEHARPIRHHTGEPAL